MEKDTLYIPMGVKTEPELFSGFGKKEFGRAFIGSVICCVIALLIWIFTANVAMTMIMVLTGIFGSVIMTTRDSNNLSVVDQLINMMSFARSQKIYPYRYKDEWEIKELQKFVKEEK